MELAELMIRECLDAREVRESSSEKVPWTTVTLGRVASALSRTLLRRKTVIGMEGWVVEKWVRKGPPHCPEAPRRRIEVILRVGILKLRC
jgi:hypothetical protein